ncbi:hypothetical protein [Pseudonocardia sp. SID8383]|uniref:hypothetical protein n=1 Tax=Pseudonocardia sp. SID8383 TaxID=2690363 RepID=UPI0013692266|nr:hypothetical protein [Pseudonocardia sp. SID8383]MYW71921.1 hypothetical protein [Pseudonocardia sp. SID8383]
MARENDDLAHQQTSRYANRPKQKTPWQIPVSVGSWVLYALLLLLSAVGYRSEESPDDATVSQIQSQLGDSAVAQHESTGIPALVFVLLAGTLLVGALAVVGRQAKLIIPLVALGALGVVLLASNGEWTTVPAIVLLIVGSSLLLFGRAHAWLAGTSR